jgi:PTS system nitrogen regulatory IIA component
MKILDVLQKETIVPNLEAIDKKCVLEELVAQVSHVSGIHSKDIMHVLMEREQLGSTGIGGGIGFPHGKLKNLDSLVLGLGISHKGVDFESIDDRPTYIFFLLITPEKSTGLHLKVLARISSLLKRDLFKQQLLNAYDSKKIIEIIKEVDEEF